MTTAAGGRLAAPVDVRVAAYRQVRAARLFFEFARRNSVIGMAAAASYSQLRSAFDDFLFATIGDDNNGMLLSVNSALARSGVDPWEQAATLARLPAETATRNLASLIAALPDGPSARPDPGATAARLIALLPRPVGADIPPRTMLTVGGAVIKSWAVKIAIFVVIYVMVMLGRQWLGTGQQAAIQVDNGSTSDSHTVIGQAPPPSADQ